LDLAEPVQADPGRIGQLLSNLLSNALTHGAATEPVRVNASTTDEYFQLSVANGGDPIPPKVLQHLFQPFFRGAVDDRREGLGLGLYIASEIAKAHGGTLTASSDAAETRFTFRMPRCAKPSTDEA
jgi:signal transduction histidine kinase